MTYSSQPSRDPLTFEEAKDAAKKMLDVEALLPRLGFSANGSVQFRRVREALTMQVARAVVEEDRDCS
jgi:hypothetical protein